MELNDAVSFGYPGLQCPAFGGTHKGFLGSIVFLQDMTEGLLSLA